MKISKKDLQNIIYEEITTIIREVIDPTYFQRYYNIILSCTIDRKLGGEREETLREIRGIPGVTTVAIIPETASKFENKYRMELNIKFVLIGSSSLKKYHMLVLIPGIRKIKGLNIMNMGRPKEI